MRYFSSLSKTFLAFSVLTGCAFADAVTLSNSGFENEKAGWGQRTVTPEVYQFLSPGFEGEKHARLQIKATDPERDRQAVYFNRLDLPTAEGTYRLNFAARSALQKGNGGARVVCFDEQKKVLVSYVPGATGVPAVMGNTGWTQHSFLYQVPAGTKTCILQLEGNTIVGSIDFDAVKLEKLSEAEVQKLKTTISNGSFEDGLKGWGQRSQTPGVYQFLSPGHDGQQYARLQVTADSPLADRQAVYFNRRDLPTDPGYYRLHYAARSELTQGKGGARIIQFDANTKVLSSTVPGASGVPSVSGKTPWTQYAVVFEVPADTKMNVLQLDGDGILGTLDYDAVSIEKLNDTEGQAAIKAQKTRFTMPPYVEVPPRTPQFPLKTKRMLISDQDVATARSNIEKYPSAKVVLEAIQKLADPWLEWSDEDLRKLLTSARVARAFDLNVNGCPQHGREIFNVGGAYPWKLDPRHPLKVTCPVGGEVYPSNDYETYVNSGFKEKKGWDTEYVDEGYGWVAPNGERYWFVAYANQWNWYRTINPAILNLSRAYTLTGDKRYAHKAAVMLYRLAEVYPSMDHNDQSRYGQLMKQQGGSYNGKVLNAIWETFFARDFAESYDAVWDSIDGDAELQKFYGKSGEQIRSFIEANLLEDAVDAYEAKKIRGNFGMHQSALLHILLARQTMDTQKYYQRLVDEPGEDTSYTGLRYALYNQVWRDGTPYESPGYNWSWIQNFSILADLLKKGGYDLYPDPKLKLLFDSPLSIVNIGRYTPSIGDSGGVMAGLVGRSPEVYASAHRAYQDPAYLRWIGKQEHRGYINYNTLFHPPLPDMEESADQRVIAVQPSRLLAGFGIGILNNPADTVSLAMTYGQHISHYHWDFLHFDLFANGQAMMPDLGYPDAMNAFVSSIFTWSANTVSHNTVVVDAQKQERNLPGTVHEFVSSPFARSFDASSPAYSQAQEYRRHLVQVDVDAQRSYVVDVFRVKGGKQHDYLLHGPPGAVENVDGTWSAPAAKGTLAGESVELGEIYDNPTLAAKDYSGSYAPYRGSGFQHLFNVQKLQNGRGALQYSHARDADARLRIHPLTQNAQDVFQADAYDLPRGRKNIVRYHITRRQSQGGAPLESNFVSVLEPFNKTPFIESIEPLHFNRGNGVALRVHREGGIDVIVSDPTQSSKQLSSLETDARTAVITLDAIGNVERVFFSGGTFLKINDKSYTATPVQGTVTGVDAKTQTVSVTLPAGNTIDAATLAKQVAHFISPLRQTVHPIASATRAGNVLTLKTGDAVLVGRARLKTAEGTKLTTDTPLPFEETYPGTTLLNSAMEPLAAVQESKTGDITLAAAPGKAVSAGDDVWFSNVGVGDTVEFSAQFHWVK